jgi:hypothetical protein
LRHEQGHFDITGLVARDLARRVLALSLDADVVAALRDSGNSSIQRLRYVQGVFRRSVAGFGRDASQLLAQLQTDPATGRDGLYDRQTRHGQDRAAQATWNNRLARLQAGNEDFALFLAMSGVI